MCHHKMSTLAAMFSWLTASLNLLKRTVHGVFVGECPSHISFVAYCKSPTRLWRPIFEIALFPIAKSKAALRHESLLSSIQVEYRILSP